VLTAVSRPHNLARVGASLARSTNAAVEAGHDVEVVWHWRLDTRREHAGGQRLKNQMLDGIDHGWVWILDDDTAVHPELVTRLAETIRDHPAVVAVVVAQTRADGRVFPAGPESVKVGYIDAGQALLRRDAVGDDRLPETYEGDGQFLERVLARAGPQMYVNEPLSFHNMLDGGEGE